MSEQKDILEPEKGSKNKVVDEDSASMVVKSEDTQGSFPEKSMNNEIPVKAGTLTGVSSESTATIGSGMSAVSNETSRTTPGPPGHGQTGHGVSDTTGSNNVGNTTDASIAANIAAATSASGSFKYKPQTIFIHKLYDMLEDSNIDHLIYWAGNDVSFFIIPNEQFSKVLSSYFKHTNIASFIRQLNMYGFHKVNDSDKKERDKDKDKEYGSTSAWEFKHSQNQFKRGDIQSLKFIKRRSSKNINKEIIIDPNTNTPTSTGSMTPMDIPTGGINGSFSGPSGTGPNMGAVSFPNGQNPVNREDELYHYHHHLVNTQNLQSNQAVPIEKYYELMANFNQMSHSMNLLYNNVVNSHHSLVKLLDELSSGDKPNDANLAQLRSSLVSNFNPVNMFPPQYPQQPPNPYYPMPIAYPFPPPATQMASAPRPGEVPRPGEDSQDPKQTLPTHKESTKDSRPPNIQSNSAPASVPQSKPHQLMKQATSSRHSSEPHIKSQNNSVSQPPLPPPTSGPYPLPYSNSNLSLRSNSTPDSSGMSTPNQGPSSVPSYFSSQNPSSNPFGPSSIPHRYSFPQPMLVQSPHGPVFHQIHFQPSSESQPRSTGPGTNPGNNGSGAQAPQPQSLTSGPLAPQPYVPGMIYSSHQPLGLGVYHRGSSSYSPLSKDRDKEESKNSGTSHPATKGPHQVPTSFPQPFEEPDNHKLEKYQHQYQYPFPSIDPPTPRTSIDKSRERFMDEKSSRNSIDRSVLTPSPKQDVTPRTMQSKYLPSVSELDKSINDKRKLSDSNMEELKKKRM